jgi:hypothetical protein
MDSQSRRSIRVIPSQKHQNPSQHDQERSDSRRRETPSVDLLPAQVIRIKVLENEVIAGREKRYPKNHDLRRISKERGRRSQPTDGKWDGGTTLLLTAERQAPPPSFATILLHFRALD